MTFAIVVSFFQPPPPPIEVDGFVYRAKNYRLTHNGEDPPEYEEAENEATNGEEICSSCSSFCRATS